MELMDRSHFSFEWPIPSGIWVTGSPDNCCLYILGKQDAPVSEVEPEALCKIEYAHKVKGNLVGSVFHITENCNVPCGPHCWSEGLSGWSLDGYLLDKAITLTMQEGKVLFPVVMQMPEPQHSHNCKQDVGLFRVSILGQSCRVHSRSLDMLRII